MAAVKSFASVNGRVADDKVSEDYESAKKFDNLKIGKLGAYYKEGFKTKYIPFDYVDRAFIRIHEVNGKLCCGSTVFQYFRMVFVHDGKEFADSISENEKEMDLALEEIAKNAPGIAIGVE